MNTLSGFPPPPYRIPRKQLIANVVLAVVCASLVLLFGWLFLSSVSDERRAIRDTQAIWDENGPEVEAQVQGTCRTRAFLSTYELDVRFLDPLDPSRNQFVDVLDIAMNLNLRSGIHALPQRVPVRREIVKFSASVGPGPTTLDKVRLSLRHPGQFALGFMVRSTANNYAALVLMVIAAVLLCGTSALGLGFSLRRIRWLLAVAKRGQVVRCKLVGVKPKPEHRCTEIAFAVPKTEATEVVVRDTVGTNDLPPWLLGKGGYVLAVVIEGSLGQSQVLRFGGWPLLLDNEQRASAIRAVAAEEERLAG